ARAAREVTAALEAYRFNEAAGSLYRFVWNVFCDWYVELAKPVLMGSDGAAPDAAARDETRAMTAWTLDEILKLLHPFMPFVTEELWRVIGETGPRRESLLVVASWPRHDDLDDPAAEAEIGWVIDLIGAVRSVRAEMNVPAGAQAQLCVLTDSAEIRGPGAVWGGFIKRAARRWNIRFSPAVPAPTV